MISPERLDSRRAGFLESARETASDKVNAPAQGTCPIIPRIKPAIKIRKEIMGIEIFGTDRISLFMAKQLLHQTHELHDLGIHNPVKNLMSIPHRINDPLVFQ